MEKQNARSVRRCCGLLIFFLASFPLFSEEYKFRAAQDYIFTQTENSFVTEIPSATPDQVSVIMPEFPSDVGFVSARKEPSGTNGTRVVLWLRFYKAGNFELPPVRFQVKRKNVKAAFEILTVFENPQTVQPELSIRFEKDAFEAGKKIRFTLGIRYAMQVISLNYSVPEDSLFEETERFPIMDLVPRRQGFSAELIPVASFEWTPLKEGPCSVPEIIVTATSYSGSKVEVRPEEKIVNVTKALPQINDSKKSSYAYAFSETEVSSTAESAVSFSEEELQELLLLREKERHSFPLISDSSKKRSDYEKRFGITSSSKEASLSLFVLVLVLAFLSLSLFVLLFFLGKKNISFTMLFVFLVFLSSSVALGVGVSPKYALFRGGEVSSIPEMNVDSGISFAPGSRVKIIRTAGGWAYVSCNDAYGWVQEKTLMIIK